MRRIVTLVSIVSALVLVLSAGGVPEPPTANSAIDVARKYEAHRQRILELEHQGASPAEIAATVNQQIFRVQSGFSLNDNCGRPSGQFSQPAFDTDYGIGFKEQDVMSREEVNCPGGPYVYNWHHGVISEIFDFQDPNCGGERLQVDSKFGHSWATSQLTGIGISSTGIQISWENGESHFDAIPTSPLKAYC